MVDFMSIGLMQGGDKSSYCEPRDLENTEFLKMALFIGAQ